MTEKSILPWTIKGESAVTVSTFMERVYEVHLQSRHRDHVKQNVHFGLLLRIKMHRQTPLS